MTEGTFGDAAVGSTRVGDETASSFHVDSVGTWPGPVAIAGMFVLFTVAWLVYGMVSKTGMVLHDDLTEAYVWGQEFQLGYNQHPPFWAGIVGLWFLVFPNREWAFLLLAVLNSAVGLLGAWYLIGRFVAGSARRAAWLLLLCTPFYTFDCFKYNANSIFLSIWAWALFFFVRALESRRVRDGVLFGVMIGAAMLSKYFAVILILTCLTGSMLHPNAPLLAIDQSMDVNRRGLSAGPASAGMVDRQSRAAGRIRALDG